jgi:DNA segregation ATPase FtsK/SpoIIIE, S-DNA-T family
MTDLISRQRALLKDLAGLGADHAANEPELERCRQAEQEALEHEFEEGFQGAIVRFASDKEALDTAIQEVREAIQTRFDTEFQAAETELYDKREAVLARYQQEKNEAKVTFREARWTLAALQEGSKTEAEAAYKQVVARVEEQMRKLDELRQEAEQLLRKWKQPTAVDDLEEPDLADPGARKRLRKLRHCIRDAEDLLARLKELVVPRFCRGLRLVWIFLLLWLLSLYPAFLVHPLFGIPASAIIAVILYALTHAAVFSVARSQVAALYEPLCQTLVDAQASRRKVLDHYQRKQKRQITGARRKHNRALRVAYQKYRQQRAVFKKRRLRSLQKAVGRHQQRMTANEQRRAADLAAADERYQARRAEIQERYEHESRVAHERRESDAREIQENYERDAQALAENWEQGLARVRTAVAEAQADNAQLFPDWFDPRWDSWTPPLVTPSLLRFGSFRVSMAQVLEAAGVDPTTRPGLLDDFTLPAACPFPERCSLLLQATDDGRAEAVSALQAVMFRLLTTVPPGKLRFTILDPVGLGQNFAAFMQLADHDELLITSRIWTEAAHLEHRLADLTAHMENVIQKYLRNQFETIEDYNAHAGEVAEPYRFLVVANFPANFTHEAARRLVSIVQSGPRCGVYTLISVDLRQPLPQGFNLTDLHGPGAIFYWKETRFVWRDEDFGKFPLILDSPPPPELAQRLLEMVGSLARDANRVEVPFDFIAPPPEQWWTSDSRLGLNVPLGRAGATKRQHLRLGQGTSQHVLVAGKTGSGKSTLLHALVCNLALCYSPDEVELYLIDFKKGVEFKTYATHELPHARVVAIESEREFGLSVLQRLDAELKARGDRFRERGVQDLNGFREAGGGPLPRILLVVDEFQEFFVEDDKLSQDAAQLLDRLVRQGRAFGLHVLLGSQTLGGAYTLARSTIDQMAVRIALQCSEADAHLILSDDNSAARLLSRPGEAIYNDANGLVEGNNPFQVVWLPDDRREAYLERVHALDRQRRPGLKPAQLVFEGNTPADVGKNHLLTGLLQGPAPAAIPAAPLAWLGEPMAIKDPTAATFRAQGGSNLLIVGQQDEAALGMLVTALISLAAQSPHGGRQGTQFYVIDGSPADLPYAGLLARLAGVVPYPLRVAGWRDVPVILAELREELGRRQEFLNGATPTPVYLFLYGLQRFRDLRRSDDDFGFGRAGDDTANPAAIFATLLREGAGLGMHTLLWCDTLNNLMRCLDRQMLREFEMRVLFQMSVADSSNLIDSPLASKLGMHRALYHSEEQGRLEKFRPYGLPPEAWLASVRNCFKGRPVAVETAS